MGGIQQDRIERRVELKEVVEITTSCQHPARDIEQIGVVVVGREDVQVKQAGRQPGRYDGETAERLTTAERALLLHQDAAAGMASLAPVASPATTLTPLRPLSMSLRCIHGPVDSCRTLLPGTPL